MKKAMILLLSLVFSGSMANAGTVGWTSGDLATDVEIGASLEAGWLVAMYRDVNKDNLGSGDWFNELRLDNSGSVTSGGLTGDDVFLAFTTTLVNPFSTLMTLQTQPDLNVQPDGANVYTVIFDATSMALATSFVVVDATPFDIGAGGTGEPPLPPIAYSAGSSIAGDYQVIPEPAVAALLGIFGGGLLVARRLFPGQS